MYRAGIDGKCLRIIKSRYSTVKSCIKFNNNYSEYFDISLDLKQGAIISPLMWAVFIEDLEMFLQVGPNSGISIDDIIIILLLFADDITIFGHSPKDLQNSLNRLKDYCKNWSLEVNASKTKVMTFRKKRKKISS